MSLKSTFALLALLLGTSSAGYAQTQIMTEQMGTISFSSGSVIGIHDPSVVLKDGMYTIWGTHLGLAQSKDLVNWTGLSANGRFIQLASQGATSGNTCNGGEAFFKQQLKQVKGRDGKMVSIPNFDGRAFCSRYGDNNWIYGNMWAPDIIYNEAMKKWCMYLSLNGDHWSSAIVLLTANSPLGPFTYQAPIIMGGFNDQTYNGVAAPKIGETDYTLVTGETSIAARYRRGDWGTYWPNCIDPCVFYDEEGQLWMSYGSWSGGIFLLKLDNETGLRDYTCHYENDYDTKGANFTSDPYFGKRIAGGYYVSGEGSYIQHIGDYYYLFVVYGGLESNAGYEMRVFRSKTVDGPYKDAAGVTATYTGYQMNYGPRAATDRGVRLMSAYNNWGEVQNVGERAQGHNSACVDELGRAYVVYHTRFKDGNEGFQDRVHQLFVNQNGWLVAAPFAYDGVSQPAEGCYFPKDNLPGDYRLLVHPYRQDHNNEAEATPVTVTLNADGKVTGDMTGTWKFTEGTTYVSLTLNGTTYSGVFCLDHVNGATTANYKTSGLGTVSFTAVANNGVPVWGYKLNALSSIKYNFNKMTIGVKNGQTVSSNLKLMSPTVHNAKLSWTSSSPAVISETGKYDPTGLNENLPVTLTARLECGEYYWEQSYDVKAKADGEISGDYLSDIVAYYDFDDKPTYNHYKAEEDEKYDLITYGKWNNGTAPSFASDYERDGMFAHLYDGTNGNNSYARMPNPLVGCTKADGQPLDGFTVSVWVKRNSNDIRNALWGFFNSTSANSNTSGRLFLTGNTHLGYDNANGGTFDLNHHETKALTNIPVGEWSLVTLTVGPENGIRIYVNGTVKNFTNITSTFELSGSTTLNKVKSLPLDDIVSKVASLKYFYLGSGSLWGSADACFDDLMIYSRELSATDVRALNTMANRVHDFTGGGETGIEEIADVQLPIRKDAGVYDLSGRKLSSSSLKKGIYIVNGKKVLK